MTGGWSSDAGRRRPGGAGGRRAQTGGSPAVGAVRVQGEGVLAEAVQALLDRDVAATPDRGRGRPRRSSSTSTRRPSSVTAALSTLGPDGVVLVAGRVGRVEIDVQTDVHRRGATVAGVPAPQDGGGQDG